MIFHILLKIPCILSISLGVSLAVVGISVKEEDEEGRYGMGMRGMSHSRFLSTCGHNFIDRNH